MTTGLTYATYKEQMATMAVVDQTDPARLSEKTCSRCGKMKPRHLFNKLSMSKDGLAYACRECSSAGLVQWRKKNPERDRAAKQKWAAANRDYLSEKGKKYYIENKEKHILACKNWEKRNLPLVAQRVARRRASKRCATPPWLTAIDMAFIQEMYDVASARSMQTGIKHHVDHIHPLQGVGLCGLHVPWNLRAIPAVENHQKLNKLSKGDSHLAWKVKK